MLDHASGVDASQHYRTFKHRSLIVNLGHLPGSIKMTYMHAKAEDPLIVLIPGSFNDGRDWREVSLGLPSDASILIIDLPGHGSVFPTFIDSIEVLTELVLKVVAEEAHQTFYIGGHSIGGMLAIEAYRQAPGLLRGIISCEGWSHHTVEQNAFSGLKTNTLSQHQLNELREHQDDVTAMWTSTVRTHFGAIWTRWSGYDILSQIQIPVLELWGDRGRSQRPSLERMQIPDRPNIQLVWIENGSHYLLLQHPSRIAAEISNFIFQSSIL